MRRQFSSNLAGRLFLTKKNYYEILGLSSDASQEEIDREGHYWIQAWHPDKFHNPDEKARAAETFREVPQAYQTLRDPTMRRSYDWQLKVGEATGSIPKKEIPPTQAGASTPNPIVAALLSFILFGGVGQIYVGQTAKGIAIIVATFFLIPFGIGLITWLVGCIDAYVMADKKRKGERISDWQWFWN